MSMLEKIARAIAEVDAVAPGDAHGVFDIDPDLYRSLARAALLAMRDVDNITTVAAQVAEFGIDDTRLPAPSFTAMIDAILKEGGE